MEFAVSHQYARGPHANQGMQHASKYLETPVEFYPEDPPRNKEKVHVPGSSSTKALNSGSVTPSRPPKSPSPEEPKFISFQVSTSNGSPQVRSTSSSSQVSESPSFSDKKHQFLFDYSIAEKSSKHKNNKEYQCPINNVCFPFCLNFQPLPAIRGIPQNSVKSLFAVFLFCNRVLFGIFFPALLHLTFFFLVSLWIHPVQ